MVSASSWNLAAKFLTFYALWTDDLEHGQRLWLGIVAPAPIGRAAGDPLCRASTSVQQPFATRIPDSHMGIRTNKWFVR
jgi:hypothetical protein